MTLKKTALAALFAMLFGAAIAQETTTTVNTNNNTATAGNPEMFEMFVIRGARV